MRKLAEAAGLAVPGVKTAKLDSCPRGASVNSSAVGDASGGVMGPIAARVLMKVMYAARYARPDLQRAICHLACFVTKWDPTCDRKLHRLMSYIHSTLHLRLIGWVGDEARDISPHLYADADLGGCTQTQRSTAGAHLVMRGPNTCFPIAWQSKRIGCTVLSTPEAELYAGYLALRNFGIPHLTFWEIVFQREDIVLQFHEDNQTMIRVMKTGRNPTMRYATRTLRLPIAWLHERFAADDVNLRYEVSSRMAADIYTKAFTDMTSGVSQHG